MATPQVKGRTNLYYWKQSAFSGGEYSPDIYGRDDIDRYQIGAKELTNFYPHPYGGFSNRPGTQFLNGTKYNDKKSRLVPFIYNEAISYFLEFGDKYIRIYRADGIILYEGSPVEVATPYTADQLYDLHFTQSADTVFICHRDHPVKTLVRNSDIDWVLKDYAFQEGPFGGDNTTETTVTPSGTSGNITIDASADIFTEGMVGGLMRITHEVYNQIFQYKGEGNFTSPVLKCNGDWSFVLSDPYTAIFYIDISNDNGETWKVLKTFYGFEDGSGITDSGNVDHFCLLRLRGDGTQDGSGSLTFNCTSFLNDGYVKITKFINARKIEATVMTDPNNYIFSLGDTSATALWAIGSWNDDYGYPTCAAFYQDRLCFASTKKEPLGFWASCTGDYGRFRVHPDVQDDDAISATLVSGKANDVQNMISLNSLLAFTYGSEWKINSGSGKSAISPTSLNAVQQSTHGVSKIPPIVLNDRSLFITRLGNTIRDFAYDYSSDSFKGTDQTLYARHLLRNHSIIDWAYQATPDDIVWIVRDDGVLLSFTYIYEEKVYAWAKHETQGCVESVCSIPGAMQDDVFFIVKRKVNGKVVRYVEKLHPRMTTTDIKQQFFVDCGLSLNNPIAVTIADGTATSTTAHGLITGDEIDIFDGELAGKRFAITKVDDTHFTLQTDKSFVGNVYKCVKRLAGLEHLEGCEVAVLANGSCTRNKVVQDGSITLDAKASIAHVGLPYECRMETLDIQVPRQDGASRGRPKRTINPKIVVKDSYGGEIGVNSFDNMAKLPTFAGDHLGSPARLITEMLQAEPYSEVKDDNTLTVRQRLPYPLTVLSLIAGVNMP